MRRTLEEEVSWAYLGAVLPDAPYFKSQGKDEFAADVGERIHGCSGEDTFALMRSWGSAISHEAPPSELGASWALWLGFLSHLVLDQEAHPMVFFLTGDYYHPDPVKRSAARARHRLLEVHLESLIPSTADLPKLIASPIHQLSGRSRAPIALFAKKDFEQSQKAPGFSERVEAQILKKAAASRGDPASRSIEEHLALWESSISDFSLIQSRLLSTTQGLAVRILSAFLGSRLREIDALCSFGRTHPEHALLNPIFYRNPVSGEAFTKSPLEIFNQAAARLASLFERIEPAFHGEPFKADLLPHDQGTSLCFNLMGVTISDGTHYSEVGLPISGLTIS